MSAEIRSFLAFDLSDEMRNDVSRLTLELRPLLPGSRWVRVENMHLTVVFLGHLPESSLEGITRVAKKICDRYGAFDIALKGVGVFSGIRNPRVFWVGIQADLKRLSHFRNALQRNLNSIGVREEKRPFRPHLTLCRFKKGTRGGPQLANILEAHREFSSPFCTITELFLVKSDLTSRGAVYSKLAAWPLSGHR